MATLSNMEKLKTRVKNTTQLRDLDFCSVCGVEETVTYVTSKTHKCVDCLHVASTKIRKQNPRRAYIYDRKRKLIKKYGITWEQYHEMLKRQDNVCAICGGININERSLAVDHCHYTGRVRCLLCSSCNIGIALLENKELAPLAKTYLEAHSSWPL